MNRADITSFAEEKIGYVFKNKDLILTALTHKSYANEHKDVEDYERLEFLGDSILNFLTAKMLYNNMISVGKMTTARANMVSRTPLMEAVEKMDLMSVVRFGNGVDKKLFATKIVSDVFESVLGAIYIDSDSLDECAKFLSRHLNIRSGVEDPKSRLQEILQSKGKRWYYQTVDIGNESRHVFSSVVYICDKEYGKGVGLTKKDAEKIAAKETLIIIEKGR